MSEKENEGNPLANASHEEIMTALFANMVMQQTNMAMMFLGKVPNPQTGETVHDTEMAQLFIDNLEMLEVKTKGNLDKREETLLHQNLTACRMAFVESVQEQPAEKAKPEPAKEEKAAPTPPGAPATGPQPGASADQAADAESRKKFSKKY